jgi:hypothetical protein
VTIESTRCRWRTRSDKGVRRLGRATPAMSSPYVVDAAA